MLRDFKFLRSNSGRREQDEEEEAENVPVNPKALKAAAATRPGPESPSRAPFHPIQEPAQNPKPDQESGFRSRVEKTPTKASTKAPGLPLRTPEKHGAAFSARKRFGWAHRNNDSGDFHEDPAQLSRVSGGNGNGTGGLANVTPRVGRASAKSGASGYSESNSAHTTPTKSVSKPPNSGFRGKMDGSVGSRVGNYAALYKGIPVSSGPSTTVVNSVEVPHFDLKEDTSFWMEHSVQVLIRVRPLNSMERSIHGYNRCLRQENAQTISWIGQPETRFTFDHVACETVDQETLFRMAGLPMVENCLSGYNSCMFAYGQTGSGKTYTMLGEIGDLEDNPNPHRGMTPRIFEFLFARIQAEEEIRRDEKLQYYCKCSFLEIYNEQITDLLDPNSTNLLLREDLKKGVYVENLSEFEVRTVSDILRLLVQGSSNRKVAATNMNRESSRSHSVFTCVIESRWEKDSTSNLRFARLNLVDLAGSERQKSSGAEGERLKEAASINKSLSTLGHVIMVLVDVANGKLKHIPYRDSRLTFLLQDSLGGNSKTMIISNVSPSVGCAAETLNTLKFAQRAKLIQNNAVVNEDSTGDCIALQHQIRLLKEELSILKRNNVSRSLSFGFTHNEDNHVQKSDCIGNKCEMELECPDDLPDYEPKGTVKMSTKQKIIVNQLKSLEKTLVGALRREKMAETTIKQLEAEKEQLNRLVCQREEDTRCSKMMLKFREEKIKKMESLLGGCIPAETYLLDENRALSEEIQLLQAKIDKNPEVTRFAYENIRLLHQLRRLEEFYEEGEREVLMDDVSKLRDQLLQFLDEPFKQHSHLNFSLESQEAMCIYKENDPLNLELKESHEALDECKRSLNACLEENAKLCREVDDLRRTMSNLRSSPIEQAGGAAPKVQMEEIEQKHAEEVIHFQLELEILNIILKEERISQEERFYFLSRDLQLVKEELSLISKQHDDANIKLQEAKCIIEALEGEQVMSNNVMEDLRNSNSQYMQLLSKQEVELRSLKEQHSSKEFTDLSPLSSSNNHDSPLQGKLKRMQESLELAKILNMRYQSDRAFQMSNEEEVEEVRRQAEVETAEVIVCMQEELGMLQQQVQDNQFKELEVNKNVLMLENELKEVQEKLYNFSIENERLSKELKEKDGEIRTLSEEWTLLSSDIEVVLSGGFEQLIDATEQLDLMSNSFSEKRIWISEQVGRAVQIITEKETLIEELRTCLEDANNKKSDVESMLNSLRDATLSITEAQHQEYSAKEKEMLLLTMQLNGEISTVEKLENRVRLLKDQIRSVSHSATVAFVVVNRLAEMNESNADTIKTNEELISMKVSQLSDQATAIAEAEKKIQSLSWQLVEQDRTCDNLRKELLEQQEHAFSMEQELEEIEEKNILTTKKKLAELKTGVSTLRSSMNPQPEDQRSCEKNRAEGVCKSSEAECGEQIALEPVQDHNGDREFVEVLSDDDTSEFSLERQRNRCYNPCTREILKPSKDACSRDVTILLLKKEIEAALDSLQGVQAEMDKLRDENNIMHKFEQQSQDSLEVFGSQILNLQSTMIDLEEQSKLKLEALNQKLEAIEKIVQEAGSHWCQTKELMELEVNDAKLVADQKSAEAACIYSKFEEAQDTMKEADIMITELIISNEKMKVETERLKKVEAVLISETDVLRSDVQSLQANNHVTNQKLVQVESLLASDVMDMKALVVELESILAGVQAACEENFMLVSSDFSSMKSLLADSSKIVRIMLEDIWSDIIVKNCAVSVLHLCHMGIFMEAVTGLNAEKGLLENGLCESNAVISDLRQHERELEMCQILKGKLLADIKSSFDRISSNEEAARKLNMKVLTFEKQISELQVQEELMLQRSNNMGSQLAILLKDVELSNSNIGTSLLDQEKLLKEKEEALELQAECLLNDWCVKDFESVVLMSELREMGIKKADIEKEHTDCCVMLEECEKQVVLLKVDAALKEQILVDEEDEVAYLEKERNDLLIQLDQSNLHIARINNSNKALEQDIQLLSDVTRSNEILKGELGEVRKTELRLLSQVHVLETEYQKLQEDLNIKERNLKQSSSKIAVLDEQNQILQNDFHMLRTLSDGLHDVLKEKDAELRRMNCLEMQNESLKSEMRKFETDADTLKQENFLFREQLRSLKKSRDDVLTMWNAAVENCVRSVETVDSIGDKLHSIIKEDGVMILDKISDEIYETVDKVVEQFDCLECHAEELVSENISLQAELMRKDDVLKGLLFDLSLLQESASKTKDEQDDIKEVIASLEVLEDELSVKSCELDVANSNIEMLEYQLQEKTDIISHLKWDILQKHESLDVLSSENTDLRTRIEDALAAKSLFENKLSEKEEITESLKLELLEMSNALGQLNDSNEFLRCSMNELAGQRDLLHIEMLNLKENLKREQTRTGEIEAIANEAQQIAELRKTHVHEKEAEVKLLEQSVEELECTVNVLQNKVDIIKEDAERQRLHGEELECELHAVKHQMLNVENANADMNRHLDDKEKNLQDILWNMQILERDLAAKDAEIAQYKAHISELNLHAEAQACEFKQKFKALESMAEQARLEGHTTHAPSSTLNKSEKATKSRGSGSPFKCIGLGLGQQIKSERDEELMAARTRIDELESLASNRQKEIFNLNARIAASESMTHDVLRDLLGVKSDMTTYASLLDNQQVQKITEKARIHSFESKEKEQEVLKLKKQLNEFIEERRGWLEEIERKQAETIAIQIALEKLRQRDQLHKTENEMLKMENVHHKKKVMELEGEVDKLSGQQNIQQRIHHHAKIKEENHMLKACNEELSAKLRRTEVHLTRVKEELARYRASCGRDSYIDFDEEQRLSTKVKEIEEEKLQLAQKLLGLCTSVLKAAGITKSVPHISPSVAEEALEQLKTKVVSLDRELQDLKLKNKLISERLRLSELMPQASPKSSKTDENCQTPRRNSEAPYFSALDR